MMMRKVADSFYYNDVFTGENENRESYHSGKSQKEEKDSTQYLCNRLLLCLFALCLLWTTTLANCVYLVNFYFPVPQFSLVMDHCMSFISLIDANDHNYRDCVDRQVTTCELNLDIAYNKQKIRIAEHESNNLIFENQFTLIVSNCSSGYNQLQTVLQGWLEEGYNNTIPYKVSCSSQQKGMISDLLNDQSSTNIAVQATSSNYISTTNARFSSLVLYSNELSTYNHNYLKNKTKDLHIQALSLTVDANINIQSYLKLQQIQIQQTFDMLIACLSLNSNASQSCPFPVNAASLYILESANVNALVTGMKRMVNLANVSVIEYRQQVTRAMTNMNNFYKSIASSTGIITWILQNTPIPSSSYLCGRSSPNWCDFSPWDWYLLPLNVPTITFFPHMPDIDSMWQQIESISIEEQQILLSQLQDLNLKIISSFDELYLKINSLNWDLLSDYDPPHYRDPITNTESSSFNLSDLLQEQYQLSKKYQNDLYREIFQKNQTISYLNENNITASSIPSYLLALGNQLQSSLLSNVNMMWVSFRAGHVNYGVWLSSFFTIQGLLFLFDYIYRVIQSVKLINSFWRKGIVQLPVISLLDKFSSFSFFPCFTSSNDSGNQSKGNTNGGILNNPTISWMITLLPYIWFQLLCLMVLIVLVALTISTILIPEYYSYIDACVNHEKSDTFLSANLAALAINYASYQGNKDLTIGINSYNKDVTLKCNEQSSSDSALLSALSQILSETSSSSSVESDSVSYVSYLQDLHDMNTSYVETMNQWKYLIDCVDLEKFSSDYIQYCQGSSSLYCLSNNDYTILPSSSEFCDSKYLLYPVIFRSDEMNDRNGSNLTFNYPEEDDVISDPLFQGYNQSTNLTEIVYANALLGQTRSTDFYCSQLPPCDVTCDGPDVIVLDNAAKDCSCMIEWYWNGMLLQLSFAVIIYIIVNISRILINKGLIKILWKELTPPVFECHLYCDDEGKIISTLQHEKQLSSQSYTTNPQDPFKEEKMKKNKIMIMKDIENKREDDKIIQSSSLFEETVKVEIAKKMVGFALIGWLLLFIAMVLNIIWIYYLLQLSNTLEYHPSYHSF